MKHFNDFYNYDYNQTIDIVKLRSTLSEFLREDIGTGDITSDAIIPESVNAKAKIICKNKTSSVISGLYEIQLIFDICGCDTSILVKDGSIIKNGTVVMEIDGKARSILKAERTALNLLMLMSGISTKTSTFVESLGEFSRDVKIASTRKTSPGLRYFEKKAVVVGGGLSHRSRLDQLILIKDNHISIAGSVKKAVQLVRDRYGDSRKIECEVTDFQGIIDAVELGVDVVMLDNFSPIQVRESLDKMNSLNIRNKTIIEVSGGITLENIYEYAKSTPDVISIGSLTHSFHSVDYSLDIV